MIFIYILFMKPSNEFKGYENKIEVKIVKVMKNTFKTTSSHFLFDIFLIISFGDTISVFAFEYATLS